MADGAKLLGETYYPSCIVNFRIRFDESMTVAPEVFPSSTVNDNVTMPMPATAPEGGAKLVSYTDQSQASQVLARIPKSASVELPAYRQAGTFRLTFDFNDLPIDPRVVRSMAVAIYMDTVPGAQYAQSLTKTKAPAASGPTTTIPRDQRGSILTPSEANCLMVGLVDNWQVTHTPTGSAVSIEGRDLRGVFMDSPITTEMLAAIDLSKDIVTVVRELVSKHPYGSQMQIAAAALSEWPNGIIPSPGTADGVTSTATRVKQGADGDKKRTSNINGDPNNQNFWDVITNYCYLVGAVPYFQVNTLLIKPARSLYAQLSAGTSLSIPTPFASGVQRVVGTERISVRRLVFGRNIEEMNVERKMGGRTPGIIEVVSLDTSSKEKGDGKLLVARWPNEKVGPNLPDYNTIANDPKAASVNGVAPSGAFGKEDVLRISVPGITDIEVLTNLAQELFEEIGRGELGGNVRTRSLASFGAGNEDPDLIRLRPGDAVELLIDAQRLRSHAPQVSPLNQQARTDAGALVQQLTAQFGGDSNLARVVVATMRGGILQLQNAYRVANVVYDWSVDNGVAIAFDFSNYVVARNSVTPIGAVGPNSTPVVGAPARKG